MGQLTPLPGRSNYHPQVIPRGIRSHQKGVEGYRSARGGGITIPHKIKKISPESIKFKKL